MKPKPYLTKPEINQLLNACSKVFKRTAKRNYLIILLMYRHGLRVSELCNLSWNDVNLISGKLTINRLKDSGSGYHPMQSDEIKLLKQHAKTIYGQFNFLFCTSQGHVIDRKVVEDILKRLCQHLGWNRIYPHILRHSCGYHLANQGQDTRLIQDYLGHKNIRHTVIYTKTNPERYRQIKW